MWYQTPLKDGVLKKGGSTKATKNFDNKASAIAYGKKIAKNQNSELVIHKNAGYVS